MGSSAPLHGRWQRAGERALAETALGTQQLEDLVAAFNKRGFASGTFRADAAWALEKRASELGDDTIEMLVSWLGSSVLESEGRKPDPGRGHPPFLLGRGGAVTLPHGSYPILSAVTTSLLSRKPPEARRWLQILQEHLERNDSPRVWSTLSLLFLRCLRLVAAEPAEAFLGALVQRYPEVLRSASGVQLLAHASWWLSEPSLRGLLDQLGDDSWAHGRVAVAELVALLGVRRPPVAWAQKQLTLMLADTNDEASRVAIAGICTNQWTSASREACTAVLESLALGGGRAEREQITKLLRPTDAIVDDDSRRLLVALARDPECFLSKHSGPAIEWASTFLHSYPAEVQTLLEGLVVVLETGAAETQGTRFGLEKLVNLALTMQRLPRYREAGLNIFERLLAVGLYGARSALDEIDAWPRLRRTN